MGTLTTAVVRPTVAAGKFGVLFGAEDATNSAEFITSDGSRFAHVDYAEVVASATTTNGTGNRGAWVAPATRILNLFPNSELTAISIRRGRTRPDQWDDVGECTITVMNQTGSSDPDNYPPLGTGRYQRLTTPSNAPSIPATATYVSWLQPGMYGQVVYSNATGIQIPLFTGVLEQVEPTDDRVSTATYTFVDRIALLGRASMGNGSKVGATGDTGRQRLNLIAQASRLYDLYNGNGGTNLVEQVLDIRGTATNTGFDKRLSMTSSGDTALDCMKTIVAGQAGRIFAKRDGVIAIWDRTAMTTAGTTMAGTFTDTPSAAAGFGYDEIQTNQAQNFLYNSAQVTIGSAVAATYANTNSIAQYGERKYEVDTALTYRDDAGNLSTTDALNLAAFLATNWADPKKSVASISLQAYALSVADFSTLASIELQSGVRVYRRLPGGRTLDVNCVVEGIELDITPSSKRFTFYLSPRGTATLT